jgi:arylsulfatase A-like enzyme
MIVNELVEFSDFLPTFADAGKADIHDHIDGRSFFNLLTGSDYVPRETIFVHYYPNTQEVKPRNGCFVRTVNYKLYSDGRFFDMVNDKWEQSPLDLSALGEKQQFAYDLLKKELSTKTIWDFSSPHRVK